MWLLLLLQSAVPKALPQAPHKDAKKKPGTSAPAKRVRGAPVAAVHPICCRQRYDSIPG